MKTRILIIDDEEQIRNMLKRMFEKEGYETIQAGNGRDAITTHLKTPADLVVTDIIMPEQEGLETIRKLKEKTPDIKIIAISGGGVGGADSYLHLASKLGANLTFVKPVEKNDLLKGVRLLLGEDEPSCGS